MAKDIKFNLKIKVDGKDALVQASVNAKELAKQIGIVQDQANGTKKSLEQWTQKVMAFESLANSVKQLSGFLNDLTEESRSFGGAMKAANTMAGKDPAGFGKLKDQVAELSRTIPMARDELANGLYQVISNGVPEDNWISYLEASAKSAVGGIADVGEVVKVTSTVIKNYGLEWSAAQDIQDKIQLTAKNGVTSFEQLAAALPSVTGQAAQLGVSFTEMLAVMSTLTGVTGNTSEVATQLGSVLTALTKESSKSQEMADKMGISFNAAAIKAAGGLKNYLTQLDQTVTAYSERTGQLKESIYSQLFGRAEALRLVNGLTGEMAGKFAENISALENSAGTMDAAFKEMSSTGSATTQMLKNQTAVFTDLISKVVGGVQPYLNFSAQVGMTVLSVKSLGIAAQASSLRMKAATVATKMSAAATNLYGNAAKKTAVTVRVFSMAMRSGAFRATALKIAIRGLLVSTGVGVAIAALTFAIEKLIESFDDAEDAAQDTAEGLSVVEDSAKRSKEAFEQSEAETFSRLMSQYTKLRAAWKALSTAHEKAKWIKDNAAAFAELHLRIGGVKDAEMAFNGNTDAIVQSIKTRARAMAILSQMTEEYRIQSELASRIAAADEAAQARHPKVKAGDRSKAGDFGRGHTTEGGKERVDQNGNWVYTEKGAAEANRRRWVSNSSQTRADRKALAASQARTDKLAQEIANEPKETYIKPSPKPGTSSGSQSSHSSAAPDTSKLIEGAKSYADLSHNVAVYKKRLEEADPSNKELVSSLREQIATAEEAARSAKDVAEGWDIKNPDTLEEIDEAISRQQSLRKKASAENLRGIDAEISRLQDLRKQMEDNARVPTPTDQIQTYEQLDEALGIYNDRLKTATEEERTQIQAQIVELEKLRDKWDAALKAMGEPLALSSLHTIQELDDAISYYGELQKKQSADEIADTQRVIQALEAKREALQRSIELPSLQKEAAEINALTGKEYKLRIKGMGFETLSEKIRGLQKQLDDLDHPVTAKQRKDIEGLIGTYNRWRKESLYSFDTVRSAWEDLRGIGDSIQGITDAIEGNGNAWQKTVAIIDGVLNLYSSISGIVGIIGMFSEVSKGNAAAKEAEGVATTASAAATMASVAAEGAAAAAMAPVIAANELAAKSYMKLASASFYAAHAFIPFAGYGIATGFVAAMKGTIAALDAVPFAKGGIVSGPTLALVGEYGNAANNPEVVAPLDKLRSLIEPSRESGTGHVVFEIDGRKLRGVLEREERIRRRS